VRNRVEEINAELIPLLLQLRRVRDRVEEINAELIPPAQRSP
jgi:hypothetical protein